MAVVERDRYMGVANTILQQIKAASLFALGSWGAREFVGGNLPAPDDKEQPGVMFRVNGSKTKRGSKVIITLNWMDTYDIILGHIITQDHSPVWVRDKCMTDVYFDQLVEVLDSLIG